MEHLIFWLFLSQANFILYTQTHNINTMYVSIFFMVIALLQYLRLLNKKL